MQVVRKHILEIENDERNRIAHFIDENNGLVFHEIEFNYIASKAFNTSFFYFIAYNKNEIIGICPVHIIKKGVVRYLYSNLSSYEIPYGGWIFDEKKISIKKLLKNTKIAFNELLTYWSNIQIHNDLFLNLKNNKQKRTSAIINLKQTNDEILKNSISKNTRHNIKRASRKGITIDRININNFHIFTKLSDSLKKKHRAK